MVLFIVRSETLDAVRFDCRPDRFDDLVVRRRTTELHHYKGCLALVGVVFLEPSAVYLRIAGANNSIVGDAKVFLTRPWIRRRLAMGPYSMDLRERVAAVIDEGEGSQRQVAKRFRVSVSFVTRLLQRRRDAGTLAPKPHGG